FREETVAGMNRVGTGLFGGGDDVLDHQIALARGRRTDAEGLVARAHVERRAVGVAVDGDGADAHLPTGTRDADRDLAAVGDEDLLHGGAPYQMSRIVHIVRAWPSSKKSLQVWFPFSSGSRPERCAPRCSIRGAAPPAVPGCATRRCR